MKHMCTMCEARVSCVHTHTHIQYMCRMWEPRRSWESATHRVRIKGLYVLDIATNAAHFCVCISWFVRDTRTSRNIVFLDSPFQFLPYSTPSPVRKKEQRQVSNSKEGRRHVRYTPRPPCTSFHRVGLFRPSLGVLFSLRSRRILIFFRFLLTGGYRGTI